MNRLYVRDAVDQRVSRWVDKGSNAMREATSIRRAQFPVAYAFFSEANVAYLASEIKKLVVQLDLPSIEHKMGQVYHLQGDLRQVSAVDKQRIQLLVSNMNKAVIQDYVYRSELRRMGQKDYSQFAANPYYKAYAVPVRPIGDDRQYDRTRVTNSIGGQQRLW